MNKHPSFTRLPLLTATLAATLTLGACVAYPPPRPGVDQGVVVGGFGTPAPVYSSPAPVYTPAAPPTVYYDNSYYASPYYGPAYAPAYGYYGPGYYGPSVSGTFIYSDHDHRYRAPSYGPPPRGYRGDRDGDRGGNHGGGRPGGFPGGGHSGGGRGPGGGHSGGARNGETPLSPALRGVFGKPGRD